MFFILLYTLTLCSHSKEHYSCTDLCREQRQEFLNLFLFFFCFLRAFLIRLFGKNFFPLKNSVFKKQGKHYKGDASKDDGPSYNIMKYVGKNSIHLEYPKTWWRGWCKKEESTKWVLKLNIFHLISPTFPFSKQLFINLWNFEAVKKVMGNVHFFFHLMLS